MSFENDLRHGLNEYAKGLFFPKELDMRIRQSLDACGQSKPKPAVKPVLVFALAALLLLPATVFASGLLADEIYGSFERLKMKAATVTMEKYLLFNAKLMAAKEELGEEQYEEFKALIKTIASAKVEYGNENGDIDYDQLSADKVAELKKALAAVQPIFDRLNGDPAKKEILTPEEYEQYIEALMTLETIRAKTGLNPIVDPKDVPPEYRERYETAWKCIEDVEQKR